MYLLDTNVVSETRKSRPHGGVVAWLRSVDPAVLFVAAVTVGELQAGAEVTRRQDLAKASELDTWIDHVVAVSNLIAADEAVFRAWARLKRGAAKDLFGDALIAATARVHGLTVATRNVRDFVRFGVPTLNPFAPAR